MHEICLKRITFIKCEHLCFFQQKFGTSSADFKMFNSSNYEGKNLLFKDSTKSLVAAGDKNTYQKWLGDEYLKALEALECPEKTNGSGQSMLSPVLFMMFIVIKIVL